MEIAPFRIKRRVLDAANIQVKDQPIGKRASRHRSQTTKVAYYAVESTAPHNIDQRIEPSKEKLASKDSWAQAHLGIDAIAQDLHRIKADPTITEDPELVIAVHGYNTSENGVQAWYNDIFKHVAKEDAQIRQRRNLVFIGYRWPSENILCRPKQIASNFMALPDVPRAMFLIGLGLVALYIGGVLGEAVRSLFWTDSSSLISQVLAQVFGELSPYNSLIETTLTLSVKLLIGLTLMGLMVIISLGLLRTSVYFRDVYRAINFGVPDLTELIRQLDQALTNLEHSSEENSQDRDSQKTNGLNSSASCSESPSSTVDADRCRLPTGRVKLSFLGHSMGALVVTNTVRVISDVFDPGSIKQKPTANIGRMLRLSHLVLASPDLPVLSVVSSRSNGLASSLRRFDEAYVFSNEGDLALRLASTAANYISFPSAHHNHGHRLGSIAIRNDLYQKGIINLRSLKDYYSLSRPLNQAIKADPLDILKCLYITHQSGKEGASYQSLKKLFATEHEGKSHATVSDLFTFFDCTDYQDYRIKLTPNGMNERSPKDRRVGLLTRPARNKRKYLRLQDYINIALDTRKGLNCHGGYFQGEFTRELMYRLVFLGFEDTLGAIANDAIASSQPTVASPHDALEQLHQRCMERGIQVYLSPLRYRVDVQGTDIRAAKLEMLEVVKDASADIETDVNLEIESQGKVSVGAGI